MDFMDGLPLRRGDGVQCRHLHLTFGVHRYFGFSLEPCHLRFSLTLRLFFLAVLEFGAPLSSSLEEALYKCSI